MCNLCVCNLSVTESSSHFRAGCNVKPRLPLTVGHELLFELHVGCVVDNAGGCFSL